MNMNNFGDPQFPAADSGQSQGQGCTNLQENLQHLHLVPSGANDPQIGSSKGPTSFPHAVIGSNVLNLSKIEEAYQEHGSLGEAGAVVRMAREDISDPRHISDRFENNGPVPTSNFFATSQVQAYPGPIPTDVESVMESEQDEMTPSVSTTTTTTTMSSPLCTSGLSCQVQANRLDSAGQADVPKRDQAVATLSSTLVDMNQ